MENLSKVLNKLGDWKEKLLAKRVDLYKAEIYRRNYNSLFGLSMIGCIITLGILIISIPLAPYFVFNGQVFILFFLSAALCLFTKFYLQNAKNYSTLVFYMGASLLMGMGIIMGTFLDRNVPSITVMVFLSVLPLFVIDKPWRVILFISVSAMVYIGCCFYAKEYGLFIIDVMHLAAFYCLAIGINVLSLNERIDHVEDYVQYKIKSEMDLMTGIYNREAGLLKIKELVCQQVKGAFIIADIDDFKKINDSFGHMYGDTIIKEISCFIKNFFLEDDIVLRMGGDEFIVYSMNLTKMEDCKKSLEHLLDSLSASPIGKDKGIAVSISIGCTMNDQLGIDFNRLYRESDRCLYVAKNSGKGCCVIKK